MWLHSAQQVPWRKKEGGQRTQARRPHLSLSLCVRVLKATMSKYNVRGCAWVGPSLGGGEREGTGGGFRDPCRADGGAGAAGRPIVRRIV